MCLLSQTRVLCFTQVSLLSLFVSLRLFSETRRLSTIISTLLQCTVYVLKLPSPFVAYFLSEHLKAHLSFFISTLSYRHGDVMAFSDTRPERFTQAHNPKASCPLSTLV